MKKKISKFMNDIGWEILACLSMFGVLFEMLIIGTLCTPL